MDEHQNSEVTKKTASEGTSSTVKGQDVGNKKTIISILVVMVLIFGALEFSGTTSILSGSKVLATVNGEKIRQSEFDTRLNQILSSPQAGAINIDDPGIRALAEEQVLNEMINTRLLLQVAVDSGFTTTDEAIQAEYDLIVNGLGGAEILAEELQKANLTEKTFRESLAEQLVIEQYIDDNIDPYSLIVSSEEIDAFYEQISGQEGVPPLSEIKDQIERQLLSDKQQTAVLDLVESLRSAADIEITGQTTEDEETTEDVGEGIETEE